jgi:acetyl esterase
LIFYVHGGGFIAANSLNGESYTQLITRKLNVPIVGIDYSKAPEYPYPTAIEEVLYTYCWALKHPEYFGSTLERIIFMAESSGSSIVKSFIIKCIENEIRIPDHFVSVCGACRVDGSMTPSRILSMFEPFLTVAILTMVLYCYTIGVEFKTFNETMGPKDASLIFPEEFLLSPILAKDEILKKFPKISFILPNVDPLLDENIELAKRLNKLGVDVTLKIIYGASHTFLNFAEVSLFHNLLNIFK